jgi:hypothetical protein
MAEVYRTTDEFPSASSKPAQENSRYDAHDAGAVLHLCPRGSPPDLLRTPELITVCDFQESGWLHLIYPRIQTTSTVGDY